MSTVDDELPNFISNATKLKKKHVYSSKLAKMWDIRKSMPNASNVDVCKHCKLYLYS